MAGAVADGVNAVAGCEAVVKRVPELVSDEVAAAAHMKIDQAAAFASPDELADYDGIIFGTPTRFGNMAAQMRNFLDQTGGLWAKGALIGKPGSVFVSTASQHGGQETTITSFHTTLLHHGMIVIGLPYSFAGNTIDRDQRRHALWREHDRRRRRIADAVRKRACRRALPGRACRPHHAEAGGLTTACRRRERY